MTDDHTLYHTLGMRDAIAELCAVIRTMGLVGGVRNAVEELQRVNPENPHIEPVLKILEDTDQ